MTRDFMGRPDRHRRNTISSRIVSSGGVVRATREAKPEPVYISSARLNAVEAALVAAEKAGAAAIEWKELLEEKGGTCLRNERHEDLHWELCGEPTTGTAMYCPRHLLDALGPPQAGNIPLAPLVEVSQSELRERLAKGFDPWLDKAIDAAAHPRLGWIPRVVRPLAPSRLPYLHTKPKPSEPVAVNLTSERVGQDFPVREVSRTITKYEPEIYTLNPAPLEPCEFNPDHGYFDGTACPGCMQDAVRRAEQDQKAAHERAQATERQRRHRLFTTKAAK